MIRISLFVDKAYAYDISGWENESSERYDNLMDEDLIERVREGDIVLYISDEESAKEWCNDNGFKYELIEDDDN